MDVVIFGSTRGLGAALREYAELRGQRVAGWGRRDGDLSTPEGQTAALEFLDANRPRRVFCVAGGGPFGKFDRKDWKDHEWAWQVTFLFPARVLHQLSRLTEKPQVILIGSAVAENAPDPMAASYCAAKHALKGLFGSLRAENPGWDIRLFSPGYIDTELLPKNAAVRSKGVYRPQELAAKLWSWTLTDDPSGHKMYPKHPTGESM